MKDMLNVFQGASFEALISKAISTGLILLSLWIARISYNRFILKRIKNVKAKYKWNKIFSYAIAVIGILMIGRTWFSGIKSLTNFLGILTAGLAIALKDLIIGFAGWLFILWRRPFDTGDRIEIGNYAGDVIDIRPLHFTILEIGNWVDADQSTGRMIQIPNNFIFTHAVNNYQSGFDFIWNEIPVLLTFESNWKKANQILQKIIDEHTKDTVQEAKKQIQNASRKFMIIYKHFTPAVYTDVKASGVNLTMRYLCRVRSRRSSTHAIWEKVLTEFDKHEDIDLAYPTIRYYQQNND